ncbi:MAG TPA: DUF2304 domain-containing protein [Anaeromyxobacteraceae bacterium]|nr:DUF2304 domain-containing protein [Anaeromyxobacteraceae bacterium]
MNAPAPLPREIQILGSAVLIAFLGWLVRLVRTQKVTLRDSLLWLLSTLTALAVTLQPELLARASRLLDVQVPSNALFGAAILYLSFNLVSLTIGSSMNAASLRRLAQECALLRGELEALRRQGQPPGDLPGR